MSNIVTTYCEGKSGSHDFDVLNKTLSGLPPQTSETTKAASGQLKWTDTEFDRISDDFVRKFDDAFFARHDYAHWFQGKDMAKALSKSFKGFSTKNYYEYAKQHFDYTQYKDLVQLRNLVAQHLT